jgi:hypothetical protein
MDAMQWVMEKLRSPVGQIVVFMMLSRLIKWVVSRLGPKEKDMPWGNIKAIHTAAEWDMWMKDATDKKKLLIADFTATWCETQKPQSSLRLFLSTGGCSGERRMLTRTAGCAAGRPNRVFGLPQAAKPQLHSLCCCRNAAPLTHSLFSGVDRASACARSWCG